LVQSCWDSNGGGEFYGGSHGKARNGETKGEIEREKIVLVILGRPSYEEKWVEGPGREREDRGLEFSR